MTRAIDILCNDFTPNGIRKNYIENEEEHSRFEQVGRAHRVQSFEIPEFRNRMDKLGIEKVFIAAIKTWSVQSQALLEHTTTEEVIDIIKAAPDCIYGLYGINVHRGMKDVSGLEQAVREKGFIGAHLHPHGYGYPPDHAYYFPFYAKCQELGVPVIVSMGHTLDLMPIEPGRPIHLDKVALYFQDLKIICTHTGWPWVEEAIAIASIPMYSLVLLHIHQKYGNPKWSSLLIRLGATNVCGARISRSLTTGNLWNKSKH